MGISVLESIHIRCPLFREDPWDIERNEVLYYDNKGGEPLLPLFLTQCVFKTVAFLEHFS